MSGKRSRERKPNFFYSPFETALPGPPPYSLSLAEGLKQREKELPTPSRGFKAIWGSCPSAVARGHLPFVKGTRSEATAAQL